MSEIKLSPEEKSAIVEKIKDYFSTELQQEVGQFDAEFLLDFFGSEIGPFFYNRGLYDARDIFSANLENIEDAIYAMEKVVSDSPKKN
jgi:uncharacterized protein (DUF2164 family)